MLKPSEASPAAERGHAGEQTLEVLETWTPTATTRAVRLARPASFEFRASQAVRLILQTSEGESARPMSIASGPGRPHLDFAARRSDSAFKHAFFALAPGDHVRVVGPGPRGQFLLDRERPAVMFAGGIGITPFRSMLQAVDDDDGARHPVTLVYASRSRDEIAFKDEIDDLAGDNGVDVRYAIGSLDGEVVRGIVRASPGAVCYLAGPIAFVRAVGIELLQAGIDRASVRTEMFRGYDDDDDATTGAPRARPPGPPSWDGIYRTQPIEQMPWFYPALDPDLASALRAHGIVEGRFLDVGTGPGTQAIELARRGFVVTATDVSPAAVERAAARGHDAGVAVDFRTDDVLASALEGTFDYALDRGCFHVLPADRRSDYVSTLHARLRPSGLLFLKCFSDEDGGGPYNFAPDDIAAAFAPAFAAISIERTIIQGPLEQPMRALFCVLRRV